MMTDRFILILTVLYLMASPLVTCKPHKSRSSSSRKSERIVCPTKNCQEEAKRTISFMDTQVDPCIDFYKFACGHFARVMPIPKGQTNTDVFTDESMKINQIEEDSLLRDNRLLKNKNSAIRDLKKSFDVCLRGPSSRESKTNSRSVLFDEKNYLAKLRTEVLVEELRQRKDLLQDERLEMNVSALFIPYALTPTSQLVDEISKMSKVDLCTQREKSLHPVALLRLFVDKFSPPLKTSVERNFLNKVVDVIDATLKIPDSTGPLMRKLRSTVIRLRRNFVYPKFILNDALLNKVKKINWPISPFSTNAEYRSSDNSLTVPAAFLGPTMFNLDVTPVLNYARAGWVVSHESGHLLASIFNVTESYKSGVKCLIEQLKSIKNPQVNLAYKEAAAVDVINEMSADVGAINISMLAMSTIKNPTSLPGQLSKLTPHQLYFLSRAQLFCENGEKSYIEGTINDPAKVTQKHPNNYYRVILPTINSPAFARAFKCKPGSPMNPRAKCRIW